MKLNELIIYGKEILNENKIEDANIISKVLAKYILGIKNNELIIQNEQEISENEKTEYEKAIDKIVNGIPLQYITNSQEFYGLDFYVDENVLIPQPDTEVLVEEVINICNKYNDEINVLDICSGSGIVGISIAKNIKNANITFSDIDENTLKIAKRNAESNRITNNINFIKSNMFENIKDKFDIIVSNPPYIETEVIKTLDKQVQNEPHIALDGGKDGLDFYRILVNNAKKYLKPNGYLCMEIGYNQKESVEELLKQNNYNNIYSKKDLSGNDRIVIANLK